MFNKNLVPWIIAAVFLVWAIVATTCSGPDEDRIREVAEMEARLKRADDVIADSRKYMRELRTRMRQDSILFQDTITIIEKEKIKLERNLARQRAKPAVIKIIQENASIDTLIQTYDSLLINKDFIIYSQEKQINQLYVDINEIERNFERRLQLQAQSLEDYRTLSDEYKKDLRKERRKKRLASVLIPIAFVGGLLLGQ